MAHNQYLHLLVPRSLIIYHHYGTEEALESLLLPEIETKVSDLTLDKTNSSDMSHSSDKFDTSDVSHGSDIFDTSDKCNISHSSDKCNVSDISHSSDAINTSNSQDGLSPTSTTQLPKQPEKSGLFLYIDFHGHASKKGNPIQRIEI